MVFKPSSIEINSFETVENFIWFKLNIPTLVNSYLIGPLNISVKLAMAFGIFVRLILTIKKQKHYFLLFIWFICLAISLYGLYISRSIGLESEGGLTIGLRIVLSIGAILIPLSLFKETFLYDIIIISKISIIIFLFGFMADHWFFIFPCLLPFLYNSQKSKTWKFLAVLVSLMLLIMDYSFTIKITVALCWILIYINDNKFLFRQMYNYKLSKIIVFMLPVLIIFYAVRDTSLFSLSNEDGIINNFLFKFFVDRGALWFYTIEMVFNSNFWVVPAGRDIVLLQSSLYENMNWGMGAHNIYLEMARQLGFFVTILLTIIMSVPIIKTFKFTHKKNYIGKLGLVLVGVYLVFGLSGNSLVYDGVGFFYWLIIGLLFKLHENNSFISGK